MCRIVENQMEDTGTTKLSQTTIFIFKCEHAHKLSTDFAVHKSIIHSAKEFADVNLRISTFT